MVEVEGMEMEGMAEEEVSRAGIVVSRAYSYSRWLGGAGFLWLGRAKRSGRGEGSSGLRYDSADPPSVLEPTS